MSQEPEHKSNRETLSVASRLSLPSLPPCLQIPDMNFDCVRTSLNSNYTMYPLAVVTVMQYNKSSRSLVVEKQKININ